MSAREANQQFSRILRDVEAGVEIPGDPARPARREGEAAHARSMERLRKGWDLGGGKFNRDELYDEILARR